MIFAVMNFSSRPLDQHRVFSLSQIKTLTDKSYFHYNSAHVRRNCSLFIPCRLLFAHLLRKKKKKLHVKNYFRLHAIHMCTVYNIYLHCVHG